MTTRTRTRPGRVAALRVLLETVRGDGAHGLGRRLSAVPRLVRSARSGTYGGWDRRRALGLLVGALYVLSPVDVVPEVLLSVFGLAEVDGFLDWEERERRVVAGDVLR